MKVSGALKRLMKKIQAGLIVTQESNPVNYLNAKEKLEKKYKENPAILHTENGPIILTEKEAKSYEAIPKFTKELKGEENV
jgi:hypothetical protein